ncbi:MAG: TIGR00730 family Rossman fold protein [Alphaproteobacteria bacterium]|nr:MAG: TIGR00730 family Rossman fold protein [Alphaproteobacteria bacterium]
MRSVCVYASSCDGHIPQIRQAAADMGRALALRQFELVYGGAAIGLMGIMADAALAAGGHVVGYVPLEIRDSEPVHPHLREIHAVSGLQARKSQMMQRADAFVALPGGFGTMDEILEVLTARQVLLHNKPIVFWNVNGYWDPLFGVFDHVITCGFAHSTHKELYSVADTLEEVFQSITKPQPHVMDPRMAKWNGRARDEFLAKLKERT